MTIREIKNLVEGKKLIDIQIYADDYGNYCIENLRFEDFQMEFIPMGDDVQFYLIGNDEIEWNERFSVEL